MPTLCTSGTEMKKNGQFTVQFCREGAMLEFLSSLCPLRCWTTAHLLKVKSEYENSEILKFNVHGDGWWWFFFQWWVMVGRGMEAITDHFLVANGSGHL